MDLVVGVDTGGTFTDLIAIDRANGHMLRHKLASTPEEPAGAVLEGLRQLAPDADAQIVSLAHGTTVATNAVLTGRVARTALVTTAGFRDVCELGRQRRPDLYDLDVPQPRQVSPRELRLEVAERLAASGEVVQPLEPDELARLADLLRELRVEAVAVVLLHSYANPIHEQAVEAGLRRSLPELPISISSSVSAEMGEFERTTTTCVNASLLPVMDRYLGDLEEALERSPRIMQSNGGVATTYSARRRPITTLLSGPAAGVLGAVRVAADVGVRDFITLDMGGTSTDVCLVQDGVAGTRTQSTVAGLPVRVAGLDVHTVGAGGGSVAWLDGGGFLRVGPQSSGAHPGPACYGRGGTAATVSDADLVLGHLSPAGLLGGRMPLRHDLARAALQRLRWIDLDPHASVEERAAAVVRVATSHMVEAVRLVTVGQGVDPRHLALLAYGGAGPVHAAAVARALGIRYVVVPAEPGLLCAEGLLAAEPRADFALTEPVPLVDGCEDRLRAAIARLERDVLDVLAEEEDEGERILQRRVDMRYTAQSHPLSVELPNEELSTDRLRWRFEELHRRTYGYVAEGEPVEVLTFRLTVRRPAQAVRPSPPPRGDGDPRRAITQHRRVPWDGEPQSTPVFERSRLRAGDRVPGPAVIEQMDSTVLVPPDAQGEVHELGAVTLRLGD